MGLTFSKPEEDSDECTVVASVVRDHTGVWPDVEEIERQAADAWGWQVARMLEGSDMDESEDGVRRIRFQRYYEWTAKIRVSANCVADGFDLTSKRMHRMIQEDLSCAREDETEVDVVGHPPDRDVAVEMGYPDTIEGIERYRKERVQ